MSQYFLPSLRQLVAVRLRSRGLSQSRIASLMGTTQASISNYLSSRPEKAYSSLSRLSIASAEADGYADQLAEAVARSPAEGVLTLGRVWNRFLRTGRGCPAHRELHPSLSDCDACLQFQGLPGDSRSQAVSEVAEAVKMLEVSQQFAAVIPEVSVNIACVAGDASTTADVVAVPGRIVKVRDRAKAMLPPEAGASAHMAKVLLLARSRHPEVRACINIRYDARMAEEMRKVGVKTLSVGGYSRLRSDDPTVDAMAAKLRSRTVSFDAIVDQGGSGIEPNVYLFAEGARAAASLALRLARGYSAG